MRVLITTLAAFLIAAPATAGMLDGYIDPEDGKFGLLAGVDIARGFEDLPEDWKCPVCKAEKGVFEKVA